MQPSSLRNETSLTIFGTLEEGRQHERQVAVLMESISRETSVRHTILDTWGLVDFTLRQNLSIVFQLNRYSDEIFDPKYDLLPRSFEGLVRCLRSFRNSQTKLPSDPDPYDGLYLFTVGFMRSLEAAGIDFDKFNKVLVGYYKAERPATLALFQSAGLVARERRPKNVSGAARAFIDGLDDSWFKSVERLNKARNFAAHTLDEEKVAGVLGVKGKNRLKLVRKECLSVLKKLVGYEAVRSGEIGNT